MYVIPLFFDDLVRMPMKGPVRYPDNMKLIKIFKKNERNFKILYFIKDNMEKFTKLTNDSFPNDQIEEIPAKDPNCK